ncbi:MAG TPA: glycosyl hydrolase [Steroidobacteraceae bacterium]|nr:glycosyl hydrolase [Steroidobacteraceae bacterium]
MPMIRTARPMAAAWCRGLCSSTIVRMAVLLLAAPLVGAAAADAPGAVLDYEKLEKNIQVPPPRAANAAHLDEFVGEPAPTPRAPALASEQFDWSRIAAPALAARPWTRWFWPGGAVDGAELRRELEQLQAANFGGAEVQPFVLGVTDPATLARAQTFDTPPYYETLRGALEDAAKLGLRIDLTYLSGYPAGGPQVALEDALQNMAVASTEFTGGQTVRIALPRPEPTAADYAAALSGVTYFPRGSERLLSVLVARRLSGELSKDPFDLRASVHLDPSTVRVLSADVKDGTLVWDAPPGPWFLVASYILPDMERPSFGAYQDPGYVVDVLRADRVRAHYNYSFGQRTGLASYYGGALRGVFNDSLEIKANRLIAADFLREFRSRRGYDLEPYLPTVWSNGRDNFFSHDLLRLNPTPRYQFGALDERVRYDYQLTLSDLVIEGFIRTSREWGEERGLTSRGQSFGMDVDVLRALGENSIPETEQLYADGGEAFLKLAASAAALYGRNLVSSESFVWEGRDYTATPGKIKAAADKLFLAGVNHIVYHGTPYGLNRGEQQPYGPQGWFPFSVPSLGFSDNVSPGVPVWSDIPALNTYIARVQNLLRQGQPDIDVLIYYPFIGFPSAGHGPRQKGELLAHGDFPFANPAPIAQHEGPFDEQLRKLPHIEHDPCLEWLAKLQPILAELDRRGLTWGWVNGDALRHEALTSDGRFRSGGRYGAVLLSNIDSAPVADLTSLEALAAKGAPVFVYGQTPQRQPGFLDAQAADAEARTIGMRLAQGRNEAETPSALAMALQRVSHAGIRLEAQTAGIRRYSRMLPQGSVHFFANQTNTPVRGQLIFAGQAWWFDPLSGNAWRARTGRDGRQSLELASFESRMLIVDVPLPHALENTPPAWSSGSAAQTWPLEHWTLQVGALSRADTGLFDWEKDQELMYAAGPARYSTSFALRRISRELRYVLDVGLVPGSTTVLVNGREAGNASLPPGRLDVTKFVQPGRNALTITYVPPPRNSFVGRAMAGDQRYLRFKSEPPGAVIPSGLLSPVVLEAYKQR